MSKREVIKKYVVLIHCETQGGDRKNFRSVPMPIEAAMREIADYARDGIQAWHEEASDADLKPLALAKTRVKERKARKKDIESRRLFLEEWFAK